MKITCSNNCCSLLINSFTKVDDYYFVSLYRNKNADGVLCQRITVTQIVTLNSSVFLGILNGDCDLVITDVHAGTELYFIVHCCPVS